MGGKSSKAPKPPDYKGAAEAEAQASRENLEAQTWANRADQYSPFGSVTWESTPVYDPTTKQNINRWTQTESLDPNVQQALNAQIDLQRNRSELGGLLMGRVGEEIGQGMDWGQFGGQTGLEFSPEELRQRAEDAMYQKATSRLAPRFEGLKEQTEIRLRNRGLRPGDQAYDAELARIEQQENDAYEQAALSSVGEGRSEQSMLFGQQERMADYSNQLRQQAIKEEMTRRGFSLNEINALLTGQQVANPQFESYAGAGRAEAPQYMQAANLGYQGALNQASSEQAALQGLMQGAATVGTTALMMCDRRTKQDWVKIGSYAGYPLYAFRYKNGIPAIGVMADEVNPEAVITCNGVDYVDYTKIR